MRFSFTWIINSSGMWGKTSLTLATMGRMSDLLLRFNMEGLLLNLSPRAFWSYLKVELDPEGSAPLCGKPSLDDDASCRIIIWTPLIPKGLKGLPDDELALSIVGFDQGGTPPGWRPTPVQAPSEWFCWWMAENMPPGNTAAVGASSLVELALLWGFTTKRGLRQVGQEYTSVKPWSILKMWTQCTIMWFKQFTPKSGIKDLVRRLK